jgi:hypothetical protein
MPTTTARMRSPRRLPTSIRLRHGRTCAVGATGRCNCSPSYEASVFSARDGKKLRRTFPSLAAARDWRAETATAVRRGAMRAPTRTTLRSAAAAWLAGAEDGIIRSRSGAPSSRRRSGSTPMCSDSTFFPSSAVPASPTSAPRTSRMSSTGWSPTASTRRRSQTQSTRCAASFAERSREAR